MLFFLLKFHLLCRSAEELQHPLHALGELVHRINQLRSLDVSFRELFDLSFRNRKIRIWRYRQIFINGKPLFLYSFEIFLYKVCYALG